MKKNKMKKACEFSDHGFGFQCKQLNEISMDIAQDIWDSCAKHLGPDCGLASDQVFMVTAVGLSAFIESMAAEGRDEKGNPITMRDVLNVIHGVHLDAQEFLKKHEIK